MSSLRQPLGVSSEMFLRFLAFLAVIAGKGIVAQRCQLTGIQMDRHWIYATENVGKGYDLLHTDFLEHQQPLHLICNETYIVTSVCNLGTLQPPLPPNAVCEHRLKATVDLLPIPNDCYANNMTGKMYEVHYKWSDGSAAFLYDVCYSQKDEVPLYARHHAYGFNLPSKYEGPSFTQDGVVSKQRADSFYCYNVYDAFNFYLGPGQSYVPSRSTQLIDRGHLANALDFLTFDQMDETYKFVNIMPQFKRTNNGNWKRVEEWTHRLPASGKYASVVSGTHGILALPHSQQPHQMVPMYLMTGGRNPIPMWSYKVVEYQNRCHAFVTLNNDFNTNQAISTPICSPITCPSDLKINTATLYGITYCCDYMHMVRSVGSHIQLC